MVTSSIWSRFKFNLPLFNDCRVLLLSKLSHNAINRYKMSLIRFKLNSYINKFYAILLNFLQQKWYL